MYCINIVVFSDYICFVGAQTTYIASIFHCLDIMFTSLSSAHLILATINDCHGINSNADSTIHNFPHHFSTLVKKTFFIVSHKHSIVVSVVIATAAMLGEWFRVPFTAEILYIGVTAAAAGLAGYAFVVIPILQVRGSMHFLS